MTSIRAQVEELGPWITGFDFKGEHYGGNYITTKDGRVSGFIARFRRWLQETGDHKSQLRILECGCLEGGHTVMLAAAFPNAEIVAADLRESNLCKARFLASLYQLPNIRWLKENFANPQLVWREDYDAIFCVGLLYHLRNPASLLSEAGKRTRFLWLWTVICSETDTILTEGKYRGRMLRETPDHPLSGEEPESFLPALGSLIDMLWDAGFKSVSLLEKGLTSNNNGPYILLQAERQL
jgi:SAM-dependent methyltransferase